MPLRHAALVGLILALAPSANALVATLFVEDWHAGASRWSDPTGMLFPECEASGCYGRTIATRPSSQAAQIDLDLPLAALARVTIPFRGSATEGHTDAGVTILLDRGAVGFGLTGGDFAQNVNNEVSIWSLVTDDPWLREQLPEWMGGLAYHAQPAPSFATWDEVDTWYHGVVILDLVGHTVHAELQDEAGETLGRSLPLPIAARATTIKGLRLGVVGWAGPYGPWFDYGELRVDGVA